MKISKISFENFRNFKERGEITFPTDGRVSVIYGTNGDGKTTLHQLFQWVFYGEVHFNKTASTKLYNLKYEHDCAYGDEFEVIGKIDFEHPNRDGVIEYYSLTRRIKYRKELKESREIEEVCQLIKKVGDDWKLLQEPQKVIENILPSGLIQYFFFDGESMIADLSQKGHDAAKSLRRALYTIFDMDIYEQALVHIGLQNQGKSSVLGKLYLSKLENGNTAELVKMKAKLHQFQKNTDIAEQNKNHATDEVEKCRKKIQELSEIIGNTKERGELEKKRKRAKENINSFEKAISKERLAFGKNVYETYPKLLLSGAVKDAQYKIGLKVEHEYLIDGVSKTLIDALLEENYCLCGHAIGENERERLRKYLSLLPPLSYKAMYDNFKKNAERWSADFDEDMLIKYFTEIYEYKHSIEALMKDVSEIDEELKHSGSKESYIKERAEAEESLEKWDTRRAAYEQELALNKQYVKQFMKKCDEATNAYSANQEINKKIEVIEKVKEYFENKLKSISEEYSVKLRESIQFLLDSMLTSERTVEMTPKFELTVRDSFGNEAKSEGQFAVVSFAYIGGIFKLLSEEPILKDKEYPLVLDGPFSKLDVIQRQNVIDTIPSYAPQIILFSKDDLSDCFDQDLSDCTWTLFSNKEKNITTVKKGYFSEVFANNGNNN